LSSVGTGIHLMDHVNTQLPYAFVCSAASVIGYLVLGFTQSSIVGLVATLAALAVAVWFLSRRYATDVSGKPGDVAAAPSRGTSMARER
jgi:tetracycline resistance efflux pump